MPLQACCLSPLDWGALRAKPYMLVVSGSVGRDCYYKKEAENEVPLLAPMEWWAVAACSQYESKPHTPKEGYCITAFLALHTNGISLQKAVMQKDSMRSEPWFQRQSATDSQPRVGWFRLALLRYEQRTSCLCCRTICKGCHLLERKKKSNWPLLIFHVPDCIKLCLFKISDCLILRGIQHVCFSKTEVPGKLSKSTSSWKDLRMYGPGYYGIAPLMLSSGWCRGCPLLWCLLPLPLDLFAQD